MELYKPKNRAREAEKASAAEVEALMASHDETNRRWLEYELDGGKLIDFPLVTDVREDRRIRDSRFTGPERERLVTARKLLMIEENHAATPAERQAAYKRARKELGGLIVLPDVTVAALEERVAPGLDMGRQPT
ncbi:hypothetical protein [Pseudarthrobacter sp. NamE2]|uniref:hypothetical protein n=1 Tax=Pseudarthrobacter sp. NamE2 TaxID=2576838 RepID=UPI001F0FDB1C|nr:hypothetical protein [Pseudarthrobacter sp. NamE2]